MIWLVLVRMYPVELRRGERFSLPEGHSQEGDAPPEGFSPEGGPQAGGDLQGGFAETISRPLLIKTLLIAAAMLVAFLLGAPIALASFLAASILLVTRRHLPQMVFAEFDWTLLVFFAALFVVSGSLETSGVTRTLVDLDGLAQKANLLNLTAITAVLSNLVSNVPAVLLLKPVVASMANPHLGGVLFDQESAVKDHVLADMGERVQIQTGNFFERIPAADVLMMKSVLHDWSDEKCQVILSRCRQTMQSSSRLLIIERIIESETDLIGAWFDLHMQVLAGGRERTENEFRLLLQNAGMRLFRTIATNSPMKIIEAAV